MVLLLGVFASLIQDAIPEGFERRHIRMVVGMLGLVAGIGLVISGFVAGKLNHKLSCRFLSTIAFTSMSK